MGESNLGESSWNTSDLTTVVSSSSVSVVFGALSWQPWSSVMLICEVENWTPKPTAGVSMKQHQKSSVMKLYGKLGTPLNI